MSTSKQTTSKQDDTHQTAAAFGEQVTGMMEPWLKAVRSFNAEAEKFQQGAKESIGKAIDNSHKIARESFEVAATISATMQRQLSAQLERAVDMLGSMGQQR